MFISLGIGDFVRLRKSCLRPFGLFALSDVCLFNIFSIPDEGYLRNKQVMCVNLYNYIYFLYQSVNIFTNHTKQCHLLNNKMSLFMSS